MWSLFLTFFKIGLFTFGGGYAMIANICDVIVEKKHWMDEEELMQVITVAESTPGPIAINLATYVGYKRGRFLGSLCATAGVVVPSFLIIYVVSLFLDSFMEAPVVAHAFVGIKCAVAFLILKAGYEMLRKMQKKALLVVLFLAVFFLMILLEWMAIDFSSISLILAGGLIGIAAYALPTEKKEEL